MDGFMEDVIFSGSQSKKRSGFAEVSITLDNNDSSMPIDFKEVVISRRLYRDGTSEYLLNNSSSRLSDIQLLLAQANVGQRSYSVVGQGMIDHILVSTPEERKAYLHMANKAEDTPLCIAAQEGQVEVIKALLEKLTKDQRLTYLHKENNNGFTPYLAVVGGSHAEVVRVLKEYGA